MVRRAKRPGATATAAILAAATVIGATVIGATVIGATVIGATVIVGVPIVRAEESRRTLRRATGHATDSKDEVLRGSMNVG